MRCVPAPKNRDVAVRHARPLIALGILLFHSDFAEAFDLSEKLKDRIESICQSANKTNSATPTLDQSVQQSCKVGLRLADELVKNEKGNARVLTFVKLAEYHRETKTSAQRLQIVKANAGAVAFYSGIVLAIEEYYKRNSRIVSALAEFLGMDARITSEQRLLVDLFVVSEADSIIQITAWMETKQGEVRPGLSFEKKDVTKIVPRPTNKRVELELRNVEPGRWDLIVRSPDNEKLLSSSRPEVLLWIYKLYERLGNHSIRLSLDAGVRDEVFGDANPCGAARLSWYASPNYVIKNDNIRAMPDPKAERIGGVQVGDLYYPVMLEADGRPQFQDRGGYRCSYIERISGYGWLWKKSLSLDANEAHDDAR